MTLGDWKVLLAPRLEQSCISLRPSHVAIRDLWGGWGLGLTTEVLGAPRRGGL